MHKKLINLSSRLCCHKRINNGKGSIENNILTIICQNPDSNATVSWLVIGERQDKEIHESILTDDNGKIIVEPQKVTEK